MLTTRQLRFVGAIRAGYRGKAAAEQAGYSPATGSQAAWRLMQLPAVREALEAPPTSLEAAAVQAGQQQRRAQLKMAVMDQLYTQAMAGNARAQIRFLAGSRQPKITRP
ncbi:hypothetical protein [Stenotrophomonas sp.]|uniref:hypothetical protein n=1 Tax=Stenotrophomonas sp. TaxID=69392 RepID=UPI0028ABC4BC|nr:hypothetical protein [Stenotrophomonas sp.]